MYFLFAVCHVRCWKAAHHAGVLANIHPLYLFNTSCNSMCASLHLSLNIYTPADPFSYNWSTTVMVKLSASENLQLYLFTITPVFVPNNLADEDNAS